VYIWIVSVRNLRVSIYSVFYNILFYYVIIIITYLFKCFLVAPLCMYYCWPLGDIILLTYNYCKYYKILYIYV
jgi:hypothetical protein